MTTLHKYSISKLPDFNSSTDISNILMEIVVDEYGNNAYSNKYATFKDFGDYLVSSHPIFNKIDEIYNDKTITSLIEQSNEVDYDHKNDIYFSGQTYFQNHPLSKNLDNTQYDNLENNRTVRKDQLENFLHISGLEVRAVKQDYKCKQCLLKGEWKDTSDPVTYNESSVKPLEVPATKCKIKTPLFNGQLYATTAIRFPTEGDFVTIIGKVKVPVNISKETNAYYTPESNLWAGVFCVNNLIAITELHNYKNGIAYFSFQLPSSKDKKNVFQRIRIVVPFKPDDIIENDEDVHSDDDIFRNIPVNSVALFYYGP